MFNNIPLFSFKSAFLIITCYRLKSEIYLKKVPTIRNNTLTQTIGFININSLGHINPIMF